MQENAGNILEYHYEILQNDATMSHTIYAAEQTIIHQQVHLPRESQSHEPAHVLMRLYLKRLTQLTRHDTTNSTNTFMNIIRLSNIW
jgi:hypothetical protein